MKDDRITIRLSDELLKALDDMRRAEADLPGRTEMIRRCIGIAAAHNESLKFMYGTDDLKAARKQQRSNGKKRALGIEKIMK